MIFIPKLQGHAEAVGGTGAGEQKQADRGQTSMGNIWTGEPVVNEGMNKRLTTDHRVALTLPCSHNSNIFMLPML